MHFQLKSNTGNLAFKFGTKFFLIWGRNNSNKINLYAEMEQNKAKFITYQNIVCIRAVLKRTKVEGKATKNQRVN